MMTKQKFRAQRAQRTQISTKDIVIADSLGGVANTYNIMPQDSVLNRHEDHAYMERTIQQVGGATNFKALITYPNTTAQVIIDILIRLMSTK